MARYLNICLCVPIAIGLLVSPALADLSLDLTTAGSSGFVNGGYFEQIDPQPTGTGVIDSFVRIQANPLEEGYNTDVRPVEFDEITDPNYTRSLMLSEVPIVNIGGTDYRQFMLDINEPNGGTSSLLSLYELQIFVSNDGNIGGIGGKAALDALGAVYDLDVGADGNGTIELDYDLNSGSGSGDMFAYIPDALFVGGSYVYLYSAFGNPNASADGFEEWSVLKGEQPIPAPAAFLLGLFGLSLVGWVKRRFA